MLEGTHVTGGSAYPVFFSFKELYAVVDLFKSHLANITFDSELRWTSAGFIFDMKRIVPYLVKLDEVARKNNFLYGVEDFPEEAWALRMYHDDLCPLLKSPHFGFLIDVGHLNLSIHKYRYIDIAVEQYLSNLPVPLIEVHLSDNHGENDQHLPLGKGNVDFTAIARGLKCIGFNEITTIEIEQ
jgi:sugar phosphate isomerase/epimerase